MAKKYCTIRSNKKKYWSRYFEIFRVGGLEKGNHAGSDNKSLWPWVSLGEHTHTKKLQTHLDHSDSQRDCMVIPILRDSHWSLDKGKMEDLALLYFEA